MTQLELVNQLADLAVDSRFNAEKFSKKRLYTYISKMCRNIGDSLVMNISLPDGDWYFRINRYSAGGFDYYIPETREQEMRIVEELMNKGA